MNLQGNEQLRRAAQAARRRNKRLRQSLEGGDFEGALRLVSSNNQKPAHYHIIYHVLSENLVIPHFRVAFRTQKAAMLRLWELGRESEPQTEWYDNGMVGIETPMPGRAGLWWIQLEVAGCVAQGCHPEEMIREPRHLLPDNRIMPVARVFTHGEE